MIDNKLRERVIIARVHKITTQFQASVVGGGISDLRWRMYFKRMMIYGKELKQLNTSWKPWSKKFPFEFREMFK